MAEGRTTGQAPRGDAASQLLGKGLRAFALVWLVLLSACQSVIPRGGERPAQATRPVTPDAGNVVASDSARHRVALLLPISGPNADIGQSLANATMLALLDTKAANVRMTTYDTARGGAAAAARLAIADGNRLILGPLLSDDVAATATIARAGNVPVISFSNDSGVAGPNVFVMGPMPSQSIDRVVRYARKQGMQRFAGLVPDTVYGRRAGDELGRAVANVGGTLVAVQRYSRSGTALSAAVKSLGASGGYDAVLIGDGGSAALSAAPLLRRNGVYGAKFLGTELWNTESALTGTPALRGALFASISDGLYTQYAAKYRTRFGKAPFRLSTLGYDSVLLVVRVARDWRVGSPFPVARLTDPDGFVGVDGAFRFRPNGLTDRMLEVQEVRAGSFATIDPAPRAFPK